MSLGKYPGNEKGISLIELVVVLALLTVVLAAGFNFFSSGMTIFAFADKRASVQQAVRLVSDAVTREIRYAEEAIIIDVSDPSAFADTGYNYIYQEGNTVKLRRKGSATGSPIAGAAGEVSLEINFSYVSTDNILDYTVSGEQPGSAPYSVTASVMLLNADSVEGEESGRALKFR
ncbi:MAG TPA: hypothetical protein GX699_06045 [Firmicutes bacterium]|nr:hypothetical protein [Bacillota bacterium]